MVAVVLHRHRYDHCQRYERLASGGFNYVNYNLSPMEGGQDPGEGEIDYSVTFPEPWTFGGLDFAVGVNGDLVVTKLLTEFARNHVLKGSTLCGINGRWVRNESIGSLIRMLRDIFTEPPVTLRFRVEKRRLDRVESSTLMIQIVGAHEMRKRATTGQVRVGTTVRCTATQLMEKNLIFSDVLIFNNFKPNITSDASIELWNHSSFFPSTCVGKCLLKLPCQFDKIKQKVLKLKDEKGRTVGVVTVRFVISRKRIPSRYFLNQNEIYT